MRTKSQHQRPFPVKGGTRCKEAGKPRMESTQLTTMYWQYAREMYSNKLKHKGKQESFGKQVQASINCKQIKSRKNLSQSAGT